MPFDPCGMWVDLLRSCYRTTIRPFFDSEIEVPIIWFFAEPGAKYLGFWNRFSSLNWEPDHTEVNPGVGEQNPRPRPYRKGSLPFPIGFEGLRFCGTQKMFEEGASILDAAIPRFLGIVPEPCLPENVIVIAGGYGLGGDDTMPAVTAAGGYGLGGDDTMPAVTAAGGYGLGGDDDIPPPWGR